jgi:hypothetical protein
LIQPPRCHDKYERIVEETGDGGDSVRYVPLGFRFGAEFGCVDFHSFCMNSRRYSTTQNEKPR